MTNKNSEWQLTVRNMNYLEATEIHGYGCGWQGSI
jgi:hypothetical protein